MGEDQLLVRAKACADHIAVLEEALGAERERREAIIVQLRDEGASWRKIALAARLSQSRCAAIVAEAPPLAGDRYDPRLPGAAAG